MLKNFIKIAWRNLLKNRVYSAINILGLAFGMAVAILIALWIQDELNYDHYHTNHSSLAQVMLTQTFNGQTGTQQAISIPLGGELQNKYTQDFKHVSLTSWNDSYILSAGETKIMGGGMWVQSSFPGMLSLRMIEGNINGLTDISSMLINHSTAKALFGDADPINKTIRVNNKYDLKVAGVYEDLPKNSTLYDTHILMSWDKYLGTEKWLKYAMTQWDNHSFQLFVQVNNPANFDGLSARLEKITREHVKEGNERLTLLPMDKWRLQSEFENGKIKGGRIEYVWMFGIIGIFVLLLACINFMNLSTARSEKRAKEVGIRKAIGSLRKQLIIQFLSESIIMAGIAFLLSIILVISFLPFFNTMADKQIQLPWLSAISWVIALSFTVFVGFVSAVTRHFTFRALIL